MKKTLMATSVVISLASVTTAFAGDPTLPKIITHCGYTADEPILYVLAKDLNCDIRVSEEAAASIEKALPEDMVLPMLPFPAITLTNGATLDTRGYNINSESPCKEASCAGAFYNVGVALYGDENTLMNSSITTGSEINDFIDIGVLVWGDDNIVSDIDIIHSDIGVQVFGDRNTINDNVVENAIDTSYLLGCRPDMLPICTGLNYSGNIFRLNIALVDTLPTDKTDRPERPTFLPDGYVVTSSMTIADLEEGITPNIFVRNVAEVQDRGFWALDSIGNIYLDNVASFDEIGFEIEFEFMAEAALPGLPLNAILFNTAVNNSIDGITLINARGTFLFDNLAKANGRWHLFDSAECENNTWSNNHARPDFVSDPCTLDVADGAETDVELVAKYEALAK